MYHRILFIVSIILLFMVSYLRYTWYVNPNFSGEPVMIKIAGSRLGNPELLDLDESGRSDISVSIKAVSIIVFWVLFGLINLALMRFWRRQYKQDVAFFIVGWMGLTLIIMIFLGLHFTFRPEQVFYGLFTRIKNFLLSPLYTGVIFIFAKFFNRIVR